MSLLVTAARLFPRGTQSVAPRRHHASRFCSTRANQPPLTMDHVNNLFAEANMSLQDAQDSLGTVYFEDDFEDAKTATQQTLQAFDNLLRHSTPQQREALLAANRPKMAQLEQQFKSLEHTLIHDD